MLRDDAWDLRAVTRESLTGGPYYASEAVGPDRPPRPGRVRPRIVTFTSTPPPRAA